MTVVTPRRIDSLCSRFLGLSLSILVLAIVAGQTERGIAAYPGSNGLIAFVRYQAGSVGVYDIWTVKADGSDQRILVSNLTAAGYPFDPAWSPDGSQLAFSKDRGIWIVNSDGTNARRITTPAEEYTADYHPTWSPDGSKLAFYRSFSNVETDVMVVLLDHLTIVNLTSNNPGVDADPAWSPDGSRIAFTSHREDMFGTQVFVMGSDGSHPTRLTFDFEWNPSWSPDGDKILYTSGFGLGGDPVDVWVMGQDGSNKSQVTHTGASGQGRWSPDGQQILFNHSGDLYVATATGANPTKLADDVRTPDWQPIPVAAKEERRIVYIQGIHSESSCTGGFLDRAPSWLNGYLSDSDLPVTRRFKIDPPAYFSYSMRNDAYKTCTDGYTVPNYTKEDTCGRKEANGIPGLALRFKDYINSLGPPKVTIVAHSMGGYIAAYMIGANPDWAKEHIASVVTFDSPLRGIGLGQLAQAFINSIPAFGPCDVFDPVARDMSSDFLNPIVKAARTAGSIVPFYAMDATQLDKHILEFIPTGCIFRGCPSDRTTLAGAVAHITIDDDHTTAWERRRDEHNEVDKAEFVACAILLASNCAVASVFVEQGLTSSTQMPVTDGATSATFSSGFGSVVKMTLESPTGIIYGPDGAGPVSDYFKSETSETYVIKGPAPGLWEVRLSGVEIDSGGEDVSLSVYVEGSPLSEDLDGDGVEDGMDNCPFDYNPEQVDLDQDTVGDVCDNNLSLGDANCDGSVNSVDALMVLRFVASLDAPECLHVADVDCSGDVDAIDALGILRSVAALPPAERPLGCPEIG